MIGVILESRLVLIESKFILAIKMHFPLRCVWYWILKGKKVIKA